MHGGCASAAVDSSLFEALFRVAAPEGVLAERLMTLGIEPSHLAQRYSGAQWTQALDVYRAHLFPAVLAHEGNRKLGRALGEGYGSTLTGRLLLATFSMLSPLQLLRRWPRFIRMGRTDVVINVTETGDRSASIASLAPAAVPMEINYGLLEFAFERMGERVTLVSENGSNGEMVVHCTW